MVFKTCSNDEEELERATRSSHHQTGSEIGGNERTGIEAG
eukprot:CAMPEP_0197066510 /NCGR_PEP_ID=MMETSP1384-20130603/174138_1 /TAXON_ID=29189 /ORGANISM="Ammonia sp." /LENGTH=39 /DNA_ID= /DNA_START= /DNA_END= /DNA_ORIENTATION=